MANEGFYDFKKPEDIKRYVDEMNAMRDENNKLRTQINDNQKALADANRL